MTPLLSRPRARARTNDLLQRLCVFVLDLQHTALLGEHIEQRRASEVIRFAKHLQRTPG